MSDLPPPLVEPARRSLLERVSIVWLVPIGALVISLAIAWQNYASRGPLIEIAFADASGIHAGETELRYREVPVGLVEDVGFSEGLGSVVVSVRVEKEMAPYVDEESEFWVVRPQVTAQGVTGLSTVLSGVYIEGSWDSEAEGEQSSFVALDQPPVARADASGIRIVLTSDSGSGLLQGTPILYRGVQVGTVANLRLGEGGTEVVAEAFIESPHDRLISTATRFWDASGFTFSLGPQGATLDVSSLAALVSGGVAFDNLLTGGEPVEPGTEFDLFESEDAALSSVFVDPDSADRVTVGMVFGGEVSGLSPGAAVEFRGVRVGEVDGVTGYIDEERFGDRRVRLLATVELTPARLGLTGDPSPEDVLSFLQELVDRGIRAELARGSILVGGLKVLLTEVEDAEPAALDLDAEPFPLFPTIDAELPQTADTAEALIARVNDLPFEEVLAGVTTFISNVNAIVGSEAIQRAPEEAVGLLADVRNVLGAEEVQALPGQVGEILGSLDAATADLRVLLAQLDEAGAAEALTEALTQVASAVETADRVIAAAEPAVAELPALVEQMSGVVGDVRQVSQSIADLPLDSLLASATETVDAARDLLASASTQELTAVAADALEALRQTLTEIVEAGVVATADAALAQAGAAAEAIGQATDRLPELVEEVDRFATAAATAAETVAALPLQDTLNEATGLVRSAQALIGSPAAQRVPTEIADALAELNAALDEAREAGIVTRASTAVASAGDAADALAEATANLPALIDRIEAVAAGIEALPLSSAVQAADTALRSTNTLLSSDAVRELPASLNASLAELQTALAEIRESGLLGEARTTLASASQAAEAVADATRGVPGLVDGLTGLTETANQLPLEQLATDLADLAAATEALLSSEGAADLPASLNATLAEVQAALAELREGGLVASANQTLASARDAAAAVETASESLPDLAARLDQLADQAQRTLAGYDEGSQLTREAQATLREVQAAARSISALARAIERNPNSLLLGR